MKRKALLTPKLTRMSPQGCGSDFVYNGPWDTAICKGFVLRYWDVPKAAVIQFKVSPRPSRDALRVDLDWSTGLGCGFTCCDDERMLRWSAPDEEKPDDIYGDMHEICEEFLKKHGYMPVDDEVVTLYLTLYVLEEFPHKP